MLGGGTVLIGFRLTPPTLRGPIQETSRSMTTDPHARLAKFLCIVDNKKNLPGVKIRDAATMLVIDRTGSVPKVLLGRRHHSHKFMPGKYVFPGGRVERIDRRARAVTALDGRVEARLMQEVRRPSAEKARGFALAAIREVFEETGLVLGNRMDTLPANPTLQRSGGVSPSGARDARPRKPGGMVDAAGDEWTKFEIGRASCRERV